MSQSVNEEKGGSLRNYASKNDMKNVLDKEKETMMRCKVRFKGTDQTDG